MKLLVVYHSLWNKGNISAVAKSSSGPTKSFRRNKQCGRSWWKNDYPAIYLQKPLITKVKDWSRWKCCARRTLCGFFAFFSASPPLLKWSAKAADWLNRGENEPDQSQFRKHTLRDSFQLNFARGATQKR